MNKKLNILTVVLLITIGVIVNNNTTFALTKKVVSIPPTKATAQKIPNEDYISNLIKTTFTSMFAQTFPKEKFDSLLKFADRMKYDPEKSGLQEVYITAHSDGEDTYFGVTNLSSSELKTEELITNSAEINSLTINGDTSLSGALKVSGTSDLSNTVINSLTVGNSSQPIGITLYDKTTKQPICLYVDNLIIATSSGVCTN